MLAGAMSKHAAPAGKIERTHARIGVIGLGYMGFDIDPAKVEALATGRCYIEHIAAARVAATRKDDALRPTDDFNQLGTRDAIIVCVPTPLTPLTPQREPDLKHVRSTTEQIGLADSRGVYRQAHPKMVKA